LLVKVVYYLLNYLLYLLVRYNIRLAYSCLRTSIGGLVKSFKSYDAINVNNSGSYGSRYSLLNEIPKSRSFWGLVLLA